MKLTVIKKDKYKYVLMGENRTRYEFKIFFIDVYEPEVDDVMHLHDDLLNDLKDAYSTTYTFGAMDNDQGRKHVSVNTTDLCVIQTERRKIKLKRLHV